MLVRTSLLLCLSFACLPVLAADSAPANKTSCPPAHSNNIANAKQAIELAEQVIQSYQLSSLKRACLHLLLSEPSKKQPMYRIDVRENHNQQCGGDPDVSPRVVSIQISVHGQIKTDNNDQLEMRAPVCPPSTKNNKSAKAK